MSTYCASNKIYQIGLLQHNENTKWAGSTMRWVYNHTAAHSEEIFSPESDEKHMAHECAISHGPARVVRYCTFMSHVLFVALRRKAHGSWMCNIARPSTCRALISPQIERPRGRSALNHSTNGVMVDSPSKKQTCPWDLLHSHAKWFVMNLLFYDQNESV